MTALIVSSLLVSTIESGPPPEVHPVIGKIRAIETVVIDKRYQVLLVDITGPGNARMDGTVSVPWSPQTSCKTAWAVLEEPLKAKVGDATEPFMIWARPCDPALPSTPMLQKSMPHKFKVTEQDNTALPGLRRMVELLGNHYRSPYNHEITEALKAIRTPEALRLAAQLRLQPAWDYSLWRYMPGAYEVLEPFVIADIKDPKKAQWGMMQTLWALSPSRTLALMRRFLPKHTDTLTTMAKRIADPRVYALLPALTPPDRKSPTPAEVMQLARQPYKWDMFKPIEGTRIAWNVRIEILSAREESENIKLEYDLDTETKEPPRGSETIIEGVIESVSSFTGVAKLNIKLGYVTFH